MTDDRSLRHPDRAEHRREAPRPLRPDPAVRESVLLWRDDRLAELEVEMPARFKELLHDVDALLDGVGFWTMLFFRRTLVGENIEEFVRGWELRVTKAFHDRTAADLRGLLDVVRSGTVGSSQAFDTDVSVSDIKDLLIGGGAIAAGAVALPVGYIAAVPAVTFLGFVLFPPKNDWSVLAAGAVAAAMLAVAVWKASTITAVMRRRLRKKLRKALTERVLSGPESLRHRMEQDLMRIARKILGD